MITTFSSAEEAACRGLIGLALEEDLGSAGDVTSKALISEQTTGQAVFVARTEGVNAGLPAAEQVFAALASTVEFRPLLRDGAMVQRGDRLATVTGQMWGILAGERTALNFLQHLSGIATLTRRHVDAIAGFPCRILDTRKTTPGWRLLEKYAVRMGGGHNHRMGLHDGVLIKDNHLAALSRHADPIALAVQAARSRWGSNMLIEVEVDNLTQFDAALACLPEIILLDNMNLDDLREACRRRTQLAPDTLLEASGGVTLQTVRAIAQTGVDRISIGALTHSAPALDIALDYE